MRGHGVFLGWSPPPKPNAGPATSPKISPSLVADKPSVKSFDDLKSVFEKGTSQEAVLEKNIKLTDSISFLGDGKREGQRPT